MRSERIVSSFRLLRRGEASSQLHQGPQAASGFPFKWLDLFVLESKQLSAADGCRMVLAATFTQAR